MDSCGLVVLVDHAAEYLASLNRQVERNGDLVVVIGWSLLAGLVRAVPVVVADVLAKGGPQVAFAIE